MVKLTQEQLLEIFHAVKKEMKPYEKGTINAQMDIEGRYDLWSEKKVTILGRSRDSIAFAALIVQSNYVGFYYMPIYTNTEEIRTQLSPDLLKLLKGKACFHIKAVDKDVLKNIKAAMKVGYEHYKQNGWV